MGENVEKIYCCDYSDLYEQSNNMAVLRSSDRSNADGGVACVRTYYRSIETSESFGSRLAFRGQCIEAESVETFKSLTAIG